ncbi:unnamed protein product [Heterobilharzia americana]|nr:unnamed protein product [Heterobilharzia americana]CAH8430614.1 unnamed protein product [Heterobilharzia americana]
MARVGRGMQACLSWISERDGRVPSNAIETGDGVYIGRMFHSGDLIPGKVVPNLGKAYASFGGKEYEFNSYEVLCDTKLPHCNQHCYKWERDCDGHVPKYAVVGGMTSYNEPLYIARQHIDGERVVGKVHEGHECAYFPYGGEERKLHHYEVLVLIK